MKFASMIELHNLSRGQADTGARSCERWFASADGSREFACHPLTAGIGLALGHHAARGCLEIIIRQFVSFRFCRDDEVINVR